MLYEIRAGVLGPFSFEVGGQDGAPTAAKQRQLLALLLINDSRVVPVSTLIEELWQDPPRSATTVIQTYVMCLRKQMALMLGVDQATVAADLLQTRGRGYVFNTSACTIDLHQYNGLVQRAKLALAAGCDQDAIDCFCHAEDIWRGGSLVDIEQGLPLLIETARLDQIRFANTELRLEAQLRQRCYREAIIDLTGLVAQHPLNERLHAYLMYALCLSGWRERAQRIFTVLRHRMVDELGLEPSAKVQRLHEDILRASDSKVSALLENGQREYLI